MLDLSLLLGTSLPSLWSPSFPLHAPALISLSLAKVRLSLTLTLYLVQWTDGSVPFSFGKGGSAYLPTALSVAFRPLFLFQRAQYAQVSLLKPASFCKLFADFGSINKSVTSLPLSDSRSVLSSIFPFSSIFLADLTGTVLSLLLFYQATMDPRTLVSPGVTTRLTSWPDGEHYLLSLQSLVVSLLLSLVSILIFSRTGGILSHRNSLTYRFPRFPPRNLWSLVILTVLCHSSTMQRTQPTVKFLFL